MPSTFERLLSGGDRRSVGCVAAVVAQVEASPRRLSSLVALLRSRDPVVGMRAADALEKLSRRHSSWLERDAATFVRVAAATRDPAVRWNLIQLLSRLAHDRRRSRTLARRLEVWYLTDPSAIVRVAALDALVELAEGDASLRSAAQRVVADARASGSAAVRARARKLRADWLAAAEADE